MNRRVAEHNGRKTSGASQEAGTEPHHANGGRAAEAAARVAARYAKAPSYSEMLAEEARAAVRAAEAASRAALEAQAAAESVLAGLESASAPQQESDREWKQDFFTTAPQEPARVQPAEPVRATTQPSTYASAQSAPQASRQIAVGRPSYEIRWDADLPSREAAIDRVSRANPVYETHQVERRAQVSDAAASMDMEGLEVVEPAQPIHANLIQFPRELVATRKVRPRRVEGQFAPPLEEHAQLSIFEVEPWTVSTQPAASGAAAEAGTTQWAGPEWSGITLDEEPEVDFESPAMEEEREVPVVAALQLAPMHQRLMASVVDFSLITAVFVGVAAFAFTHLAVLPSMRMIGLASVAGLGLTAVVYTAFFRTLGKATPGMKYARMQLCTFAGERPSLSQRWGHMAAFVLSLLPAGMKRAGNRD